MKTLKVLSLLVAISSCSNEQFETNEANEDIDKIKVTVASMNQREETRTTITKDPNNKTVFVWSSTDEIGIFPNEGNQVGFSMADGAGSSSAVFTGGGWGLKTSSTYAAYYPLIGEFYLDKTAIPMKYSGQVQKGNGNSDHLAKYDYMSAPASNPSNGTVNFAFDHLGTLLHFKFTLPEAAELTSIIVNTNGELTEKATLNLTTNEVTARATNAKQTLLLENVNVAANGVLDAYMMIAAVDLTGKTLEATVTSAAGDVYVAELTAQNFKRGDVWNYTRTLTKEVGDTYLGHAYVDLGITDENGNKVLWATTNVGADNPWDYGGYYAWGETKAYGEEDTSNLHNYAYTGNNTYTKTYYDWSTYKWAIGDNYMTISKYSREDNNTSGLWYEGTDYVGFDGVKNQTKLDAEDDAATTNWGIGWRMPTESEQELLRVNCYWKWVTEYKGQNVNGYVAYKAKTNADKGKFNISKGVYSLADIHIFFPAAGYHDGSSLNFEGDYGCYWSSELPLFSSNACKLDFSSFEVFSGSANRYIGRTVRAVYVKQN